jgi:2-C-methyl-D-erythritol 4-phosphate cytidylyltransferase
MNGLRGMMGFASNDDVVLIHDGVRPLITEELLRASIAVASTSDGALVAVPAKDTIKRVENGIVTGTPARETLWQAQTPQAFRYNIIFSAHQAAETDHYLGTDDSSLVERAGGRTHIVQGDYHNIKITTPEDLVMAEAFLASARKERILHG